MESIVYERQIDEKSKYKKNTIYGPSVNILWIFEVEKAHGLQGSHRYKRTVTFKIPEYASGVMGWLGCQWRIQNANVLTMDEVIGDSLGRGTGLVLSTLVLEGLISIF
jgi:hypothetical protein